jgi:hypothetical protein
LSRRLNMPIDHYCDDCGLTFSTGVYAVRSHYPGRHLLVCQACGTVHEYQWSPRNSRPPRLLALPEPLLLPQKPERPTFLDKRLKWTECLVSPVAEGEVAELDFRNFTCFSCKESGTLTGAWKTRDKGCPRCRAKRLVECGGWIA